MTDDPDVPGVPPGWPVDPVLSPRHGWFERLAGSRLEPRVTVAPTAGRATHRCDALCSCPADGRPMWYAPSTGEHACQDPDCVYAHPGG